MLKAALDGGSIFVMVIFLVGIAVVFIGALRHIIPIAWATPDESISPVRANLIEFILVFAPLAVLLGLGLWMPKLLFATLNSAANIIATTGRIMSSGVTP
jgi:hypothetical protein